MKCLEIKDAILRKHIEGKKPVEGDVVCGEAWCLISLEGFGVFRKQVQEGRERWKIPEREGCQALVKVRHIHCSLIRVYILK